MPEGHGGKKIKVVHVNKIKKYSVNKNYYMKYLVAFNSASGWVCQDCSVVLYTFEEVATHSSQCPCTAT